MYDLVLSFYTMHPHYTSACADCTLCLHEIDCYLTFLYHAYLKEHAIIT